MQTLELQFWLIPCSNSKLELLIVDILSALSVSIRGRSIRGDVLSKLHIQMFSRERMHNNLKI